jgi:hypothetical protein
MVIGNEFMTINARVLSPPSLIAGQKKTINVCKILNPFNISPPLVGSYERIVEYDATYPGQANQDQQGVCNQSGSNVEKGR